jgi:serine/threonine-protein kinase
MPLSSGDKLGPPPAALLELKPSDKLGDRYQLISKLGAGGMGEVWKARDTELDRDVALKVSKAEFTARFKQEARAMAAFSHPNICQIHDVGSNYIVMELIDGAQLSGPLPVDKAVAYAGQILDALDAAHRKGFTHRDLKPANVMVTAKGVVKLLDFGLARRNVRELGPDDVTGAALTKEGNITGTLQYMSPEQLNGKEADARSDIFAFGCVLYEMLSGKKAFSGSTTASVIAAIMEREPEPLQTTPPLDRVIRKCLAKDPDQRFQTARDLKTALLWAMEESPATARSRSRFGKGGWVAAAAALAVIVLAGIASWAFLRTPPAEPHPVSRWTMAFDGASASGVAISRDGTRMAYAEGTGVSSHLVVRMLDQFEAKPLADTKGGTRPFFSPDGQWLAYFSSGGTGPLRKVPVTGGTPVTLCDQAGFYGGSWGEDDRIVFSDGSGLMRVSASGGACESLTKGDPQKNERHSWPQILPGGQAVLFTIGSASAYDSARTAVLDLKSRKVRVVASGGSRARYVASEHSANSAHSGHLVYVRGGTLFAAPFDLKRLTVTGGEVPLIGGVYYNSSGGFADYAFSDSGLLLYMTETREATLSSLEWRDRKGNAQPLSATQQTYNSVSLSPDGRHAALSIAGRLGGNQDIWILDLTRSTLVRLTSEGLNNSPQWTPDGQRVTFRSTVNRAINWMSPDGAGKTEMLVPEFGIPRSWTPDGKTFLYTAGSPSRIWALPAPGGKPQPLFETTAANLSEVRVSPDGRWVAYTSDETGKSQVYARALPGPGGKTPISVGGGQEARWSRDGRELFYRDPEKNQLLAVEVQTGPELRAGQPKALFELNTSAWDVAPDGQRFLVVKAPQAEAGAPQLNVVVNFGDELQRKVPAGK